MTTIDNYSRDKLFLSLVDPISTEIISQGAEALIYIAERHPYLETVGKCIVKFRPRKNYRHPVLDKKLTKQRTLAEARVLRKLASIGIPVPKLYFVDPANGLIWMELIRGKSLKAFIWDTENQPRSEQQIAQVLLAVGNTIAQVHLSDTVHGDITTSNILLNESLTPVVIDFGLASQTMLAEDKAVDLYVLERAVQSTHPVNSDNYNRLLLQGYREGYENAPANKISEVLNRLEQVRMRGRKRSMVG